VRRVEERDRFSQSCLERLIELVDFGMDTNGDIMLLMLEGKIQLGGQEEGP
jgi:hypothetical protein